MNERRMPTDGGRMVRAFETAVQLILKMTEDKMELTKHVDAVVDGARQGQITYREIVHVVKKRFVTRVLESNGGNQCKAARELGMHRNTMHRTIHELGISLEGIAPYRKQPAVEPVVQRVDKEEFQRLA
jgi:Fis family transcriptional regulator